MPGSTTNGHSLGRLANNQRQNAIINNAREAALRDPPVEAPRWGGMTGTGNLRDMRIMGIHAQQQNFFNTVRRGATRWSQVPGFGGGGGGGYDDGGGGRGGSGGGGSYNALTNAMSDADIWEADQNLAAARDRNASFASVLGSRRSVGGGGARSYLTGRGRFRPSAGAGGLIANNISAAANARRNAARRNFLTASL